MGFNKSARREAQRQQEEALRLQREAFEQNKANAKAYQSTFDERNASVIKANKYSSDFVDRYNKGEDISTLDPSASKYANQVADQVTKTHKTSNQLGSNAFAKGDAGYQAKLNSVASRDIAKGMAGIANDSLLSNVSENRGMALQTSNMLNADTQAGYGMDTNVFDLSSSMFRDTSAKRKQEDDIGMAKMNMLMSGVFGGLSGITGVGALFKK